MVMSRGFTPYYARPPKKYAMFLDERTSFKYSNPPKLDIKGLELDLG